MKNKVYVIALLVLGVGTMLLFGTSYSLILNNNSNNEYNFNIKAFFGTYTDEKIIDIENGVAEYTFNINNIENTNISYRLDIIEHNLGDLKDKIRYSYSINDGKYSEIYELKNNYTIKQNKTLQENATDVYKLKILLSNDNNISTNSSLSIVLTANKDDTKYLADVIKNNDNSPKYVWFNCKDNNCEKWRVIGSFYNKNESSYDEYLSVKIVNTKVSETLAYNVFDKIGNYDDSYIDTYANGYYYDSLDTNTQKLILNARWNIGEVKNYNNSLKEEEKKIYYANVGLLSPSDYVYIKNETFINNTMLLNKTNGKVNIISNGIKIGDNFKEYNFLPVVYLRADVSVNSGDGSYLDPYELVIKYPINY